MDKYEEALERAREIYNAPVATIVIRTFLEQIFPELKESKDERIRKAIGVAICGTNAISTLEANGSNLPEALDYLEKQKDSKVVKFDHDREQKPAEEDKTNGWTGVDLGRYLSCLQHLGTGNPLQPETINSKWFKEHCRPQPHWKPSEEQISALEYFIRSWGESGTMSPQNPTLCAAKTLLNDIKKL